MTNIQVTAKGGKSLTGTFPNYVLDFGKIFQGRKNTCTQVASEVLELLKVAAPDEAFTIEVLEGEHLFSVDCDHTVVGPAKAAQLKVAVGDRSIGHEYGTPKFKVIFRESETEIFFTVKWNNYLLVADIQAPVKDPTYKDNYWERWTVMAQLQVFEGNVVPVGEKLNMEILIDDDKQFPTPVRIIGNDGSYTVEDETVEVIGRRGVMVTFDEHSTNSSKAEFYVKKEDTGAGVTTGLAFGEHSDKGIYSIHSDYLKVLTVGGPLNFTMVADVANVEKSANKVAVPWRLLKEVPAGLNEIPVNVLCAIPKDEGGYDYVAVYADQEGGQLKYAAVATYTRPAEGSPDRNITAQVVQEFNPRAVKAIVDPLKDTYAVPAKLGSEGLAYIPTILTSVTPKVVEEVNVNEYTPSVSAIVDGGVIDEFIAAGGEIDVRLICVVPTGILASVAVDSITKNNTLVHIKHVQNVLGLVARDFEVFIHIESGVVPAGYTAFSKYKRLFTGNTNNLFKMSHVSHEEAWRDEMVSFLVDSTNGLPVLDKHINVIGGDIYVVRPVAQESLAINDLALDVTCRVPKLADIRYLQEGGTYGVSFAIAPMDVDGKVSPANWVQFYDFKITTEDAQLKDFKPHIDDTVATKYLVALRMVAPAVSDYAEQTNYISVGTVAVDVSKRITFEPIEEDWSPSDPTGTASSQFHTGLF